MHQTSIIKMQHCHLLDISGLEVVDNLVPFVFLGDDGISSCLEIAKIQLPGGVTVLSDTQENILSVVRDIGTRLVQGILRIEKNKNIIRLRSADSVVEQSLVDVGGSLGSCFDSVNIGLFEALRGVEVHDQNEVD